ncbi:hypothetical protein PMIN01_09050 [Paraphaeosphaeria minitans]|uniref:Uncharacterized protein n=1 Tax=Paraphaeosphaeria minitans TaxID=565426 RepID=A0A9P6GCU6_9PLEO|nr:hypothetical protein PMIN01_09050 [Paraphaeosphaeria minitans]
MHRRNAHPTYRYPKRLPSVHTARPGPRTSAPPGVPPSSDPHHLRDDCALPAATRLIDVGHRLCRERPGCAQLPTKMSKDSGPRGGEWQLGLPFEEARGLYAGLGSVDAYATGA